MDAAERAKRIKLVAFDVDGVLTDGKIIIGSQGELYKSFDAHDGLGIALLRLSGVKTAIVTGRQSEIVERRGAELGIDKIYQGEKDKARVMRDLRRAYSLAAEEIAFVGDDLMDIPAMQLAGLACAVGSAAREVKEAAHFIADRNGGDGAVRQIAEMMLKAKGRWDGIISSYTQQKPLKDIAQ